LRYWNNSLLTDIDKSHFVNFHQIKDNLPEPLALRYHGHQFQHYNPDLGDGRGFLFAQIKKDNQWYDLGTKGSGQTPYSRNGDGRLTLKGAYREALATEMLESLGVNTSRTLCFFETGENLSRNDEPSPTRSAVLTRFTLGHIRIGTFQRLAYFRQTVNIKKLTSYCMNFYYAEKNISSLPAEQAAIFLNAVVERNARLVAQVIMAGFVHGVLNTDNINISGELFDYGPYRFMPEYNPEFTAAYFDHQGLYAFGRQPASFLWNLHQLAGCLKTAFPELPAENILGRFSDLFNSEVQSAFLHRLNLKPSAPETNASLLASFFGMMQENSLGFEQVFFDFFSKRVLTAPQLLSKYEKIGAALLRQIEKFEIENEELVKHPYFAEEAPCTLLIEEIESIWKDISDRDDWSAFEKKLQSIRNFRGIY
jgi:uncharacterized protein YdiU (UPF0061 family)